MPLHLRHALNELQKWKASDSESASFLLYSARKVEYIYHIVLVKRQRRG